MKEKDLRSIKLDPATDIFSISCRRCGKTVQLAFSGRIGEESYQIMQKCSCADSPSPQSINIITGIMRRTIKRGLKSRMHYISEGRRKT